MRFKLTTILLLLLTAGDALALGLGRISLHSQLGARLRAEVELVGVATENRLTPDCFHLSQPTDPDSGVPILTRGHIAVDQRNGKARLLIGSEQVVNDPVLQISIRASCNAEVVRDYLLIIDPVAASGTQDTAPPTFAVANTPVPVRKSAGRQTDKPYPDSWWTSTRESATSISRILFPRQPSAKRRFLKALQAANPEVSFGADWDTPLASGLFLIIPDTRRPIRSTSKSKANQSESLEPVQPDSKRKSHSRRSDKVSTGGMTDRLSISGRGSGEGATLDDLTLRLATELSHDSTASVSENQRSIFRLEYKLLTALHDQVSQQLNLAEQVRKLESSFAKLQAANDAITSPAHQTRPLASTTLMPAAKETSAPAAPRIKETSSGPKNWQIGMAGVLTLLLMVSLLVWILRRHALSSTRLSLRSSPQDLQTDETLLRSIPDEIPLREDREVTQQTPRSTRILDDSERSGTNPPIQVPATKEITQVDSHGSTLPAEQEGFNPVMELVDIMLAFGRVKGATEALLEYIEVSPDEALQPWLKLLDIYRQNGMRTDFESLSQKLKLHFNVAPADWEVMPELSPQISEIGDEVDAPVALLLSRLPNIGQLSHIRDEIARTWGTQESVAYLNKLLRDNRNGERQGFSLPTINELLFLLNINEKRVAK